MQSEDGSDASAASIRLNLRDDLAAVQLACAKMATERWLEWLNVDVYDGNHCKSNTRIFTYTARSRINGFDRIKIFNGFDRIKIYMQSYAAYFVMQNVETQAYDSILYNLI